MRKSFFNYLVLGSFALRQVFGEPYSLREYKYFAKCFKNEGESKWDRLNEILSKKKV